MKCIECDTEVGDSLACDKCMGKEEEPVPSKCLDCGVEISDGWRCQPCKDKIPPPKHRWSIEDMQRQIKEEWPKYAQKKETDRWQEFEQIVQKSLLEES